MTQPGVASLPRGGVKPTVAGGSLWGLRVEAPWLPLPGVQGGPPFVLGSPRCQLWEESWRERESRLGRHLCVGDRWGRLGGREGKPFSSGSGLSLFFTLTK